MAITIDWGARIIYVPQSFLSYIGGTNYTLDTIALKIALRDAEDSEVGVARPSILNFNTSVLLGGIGYAPIVEIINGYSITFENGLYAVTLVGSNNNILDVVNLNQVAVRSNNSAGLVQMLEIQHSSFNGVVSVDTVSGATGSLYPYGTTRVPTNNLPDAKQIATARGFRIIEVSGDVTLNDVLDFTGFRFRGSGIGISEFTVESAANVYNCTFENASITGVLDGDCRILNCAVGTLQYVSGVVSDSILDTGVITLGAGEAYFLNCFSEVPDNAAPIIDFGGAVASELAIRNYSGSIVLRNKSSSNIAVVELNTGHVTIDSTITAGTIIVRGTGTLVDNSTGTTIVDTSGLLSVASVAGAIWDAPVASHVTAGSFGKFMQSSVLTVQKFLGLK